MSKTHSVKRISLSILITLVVAASVFPFFAFAQTFPPTTEETLIQSIELRATRDVEFERQSASISDLEALFGEDANAVGMTLAEVVEIYENSYSSAKSEDPWWAELQPNAGWIAAGIIAVLAVLWGTLIGYLTRFFNWLIEGMYNKLAGYRPFWWIARRRYRRALVREYQELKIPFRPNKPLQLGDVYVPLKVTESDERDLVDAHTALGQNRRLMVLGAPGTGKTMLMRQITLTYAREGLGDYDGQPIPILLELHRLNDPKIPLMDHLTAALERHDFPNAQSFIKVGLKHGFIMFLFDGFDEVNQELRGRVAMEIKDLLQQGAKCRATVTCRTAVYNDEFSEWSDQNLVIVEFDDRQIQNFFDAWVPEMPSGKSVEHLLQALQDRPRIMALARNPLLLTIIAYLYSDTPFVLPHSRSEFYERSTTVLLDQWDHVKQKHNQYKASQKRLVLQSLALYYQERAPTLYQDRRSVALIDILAEVRVVLPSLNLDPSLAQSFLDEIVERSGLLIALDGGTRFQFTHLTLQEFFAAHALKSDPDKLVEGFKADRGAWRETVKLWCGLNHDSTSFITEIEAIDHVTALECLGDVKQIEPEYAANLIRLSLTHIGEADTDQKAVERALAIVAADPRPRGVELFNNLVSALVSPAVSTKKQIAAARVLSLTNLPQAADVMAERSKREPILRPLLIQMGNLAVPALANWAADGEFWALNALFMIGTSQAANALTSLLWATDKTVQYQAAWRLGTLLSDPGVETDLGQFPLTTEQRQAAYMDWIWEPFEPDLNAPLRVIGGRIAYLIYTTSENALPPADFPLVVDERLAIPLCGVAAQADKLNKLNSETTATLLQKSREIVQNSNRKASGIDDQVIRFTSSTMRDLSDDEVWRYLFCSLPPNKQFDLVGCLLKDEKSLPKQSDWRNILRPIHYTFNSSPQAKSFRLGVIVFVCIVLARNGEWILQNPPLFTWSNVFVLFVSLFIAGTALVVLREPLESEELVLNLLALSWFVVAPVAGIIVGALRSSLELGAVAGAVVGAVFGAFAGVYTENVPGRRIFTGIFLAAIFAFVGASVGAAEFDYRADLMSSISDTVPYAILVGFAATGAFLGAIGGAIWGNEIGVGIGKKVRFSSGIRVVSAVLVSVIGGILLALAMVYFSVLLTILVYYPTVWLHSRWNIAGASGLWGVILILTLVMSLWGAHLDRRARNPLQGLLGREDAFVSKYSVKRHSRYALFKGILPFPTKRGG